MAGKIFINYRRDDSAAHALNVAQYLEREFGPKRVFLDIDRIGAGANFPKVLRDTLGECGVMLVMIGPSWLNSRDKNGIRRLDDPGDWVRMEIAHAIDRKVAVVPVLVGGAKLPDADDLPEELRPIVEQQASVITTNGFKHEMAGLAQDVRGIIGSGSVWPKVIVGGLAAALALLVGYGSVTRHIPEQSNEDVQSQKCERFWEKIKDSDGEGVLQAYINECADSFHGRLAAARLSALRADKQAAAEAQSARLEESRRAAQKASEDKKKQEAQTAATKADEKAKYAALGPPAKNEASSAKLSYFTWQTSPSEIDPGLRVWTRQGEAAWKETWPSGTTTFSQRVARIVVEGCSGTVVSRIDEPDLYLFLPDRGCSSMIFRFRRGKSGPWIKLAMMKDVR